MEVDVNIWGVLAATVAAMVVGFVWYAKPVFGADWIKLTKINEKKAKADAPIAMLGMFVFAFIAAYVLAFITFIVGYFYASELSYMGAAFMSALLVWLGFLLYATVPSGLFEQKPARLTLINAGNQLVTFLAMALMLGWVGL